MSKVRVSCFAISIDGYGAGPGQDREHGLGVGGEALAEKAGKLIPGDVQGRTRVVQWCSAAVGTVEPTLTCLVAIFDSEGAAPRLHAEVPKLASRWLGGVERRLDDREWIACGDFTAADITERLGVSVDDIR